MRIVGILLGTLFTGILLTLGISSLFLLSSRGGDRNLLRRNCFLRAYIIVLLSTALILSAEGFVIVVTDITTFFSLPQDTTHENFEMWGKITGSTMAVIVLLADGILVHLSRTVPSEVF